jgi:acyl carrier protein
LAANDTGDITGRRVPQEAQGGCLDIRSDIRGFILDNFMMGRDPQVLTDSGSLLELGIIDSTGVLELVGFMEEKFNLQVEDEDLVPENLDSVDNLVEYIEHKRA